MNRRGFSLVELLVSCAILSIVLLLLARIVWWVEGISVDGSTRFERRQTVRTTRDFINRELQAAALPANRVVDSSRGDLQLVINPASVPATYQNPHAIFWQAPIATNKSEGTMAEVGYFVRWRENRAMLCRLFLNPSESRTLLGGDDVRQRVYTYPGDWVNERVLDAAAPADQASGYHGLFAENVIAFWARPLSATGALIFNRGANGYDSNVASGGNAAPALPSSIEISFVALDSKTAARLAADPQAADLISSIQSLASVAGSAKAGESPASNFLDSLEQRSELRFLYLGATQSNILVDLK